MLATASSSGVGAGVPSRRARDSASPWSVYWLLVSRTSSSVVESCAYQIRHGRLAGAFTGISISIRPVVPKILTRWYGDSCVEQVNVAVPEANESMPDTSRSVLNLGSYSTMLHTRVGSAPKMKRENETL